MVTFKAAALPQASTMTGTQSQVGNVVTDGSGNSTVYLGTDATTSTATMADLLSAIDIASGARSITGVTGGTATLSAAASAVVTTPVTGTIRLSSSTGSDLNLSGEADILNKLKLSSATGSGAATVSVLRTTTSATLGTLVSDGSTLSVNGKTITFKDNAPPPTTLARGGVVAGTRVETDGSGNSTVYLKGATMSDVLTAVDLASGVQTATIASGAARA